MFRLSFCLLSLVFSSLLVLGQGEVPEIAPPVTNVQPPSKPIILDVPKQDSSVVKPDVLPAQHGEKPVDLPVPKAGPTTAEPVAPTEVSTDSEKTTTVKPTEAPTTPPTTTTTTTTTTTPEPPTPPKPTPAPAPKPVPAPTQGKWFYTDSKNVTCIIVQFAAQLNVTYTNTSSALAYALLNVPANATVSDGSCNGTEQWLVLAWPSASGNSSSSMTLTFRSNATTSDYQLLSLNVSVSAEELPNAQDAEPVALWHGAGWTTPLRTSYHCAAPAPLNLTAPVKNAAASLALTQLQEEAFRTAASQQFSSPRECGGGDVTDAVPIAVGCALAGLVVVMLAAYLIGRRRSAAHGYLSM